MYRQSYDEVDTPIRPRRPSDQSSDLYQTRKQKTPDIFQNELADKLKARKKLGLTADLTSEDSDDEVGNLDSHTQFGMKRPQSATKRPDRSPEWHPNHGDTLPRGGDSSYSSHRQSHYEDDEDREVASATMSGGGGFPTLGGSGLQLPGAKKPSPRDQLDSGLHGRKTPTGRHTPGTESGGLTNEEKIFGRKTPTEEQKSKGSFFKRKSPATSVTESMAGGDGYENRQWQPPSFNKSATDQRDLHNRTPSPAGSRGRKTPSSLDPISESATPRDVRGDVQARPRLRRQGSTSSDKMSPRTLSVESSPRSDKPTPRPRLSGEKEAPKGRTSPLVDIFGKPRRMMDEEEPELESEVKPKPRRRGSSEMSKTAPSGRKTPTGVKTTAGHGTRTFSKTLGRSTPNGRKSPLEEKPKAEKPLKKQESLLSFLTGETEPTEAERTSKMRRSSREDLSREHSKDNLKRERSRENLTRDRSRERLTRQRSQDSLGDSAPMISLKQSKPAADDSSVCEELSYDPQSKTRKAQTDSTIKLQRSDRKKADEAICEVADAQMSFIDPAGKGRQKSATKDRKTPKHRPQPRYPTLPGQSTEQPPQNFEDTVAIRQAIYDQWYRDRMKESKKKALEQKKKEKEEEEKKKKELEEKEENRKLAFTAWSEKKHETLKEVARKKKEEERKKEEKEKEEREAKEKDKDKTFTIWKERKDDLIKEKEKVKIRQKKEEEREKQRKQREKEAKNSSAFTSWKSKKEIYLLEKAHEEKRLEKTKKYEKTAKELKEEEAIRKYNEWLKLKENRENEERYKRTRLESEMEERPAWSPPNRTVPFGR
ncbi:protein maph-9-like isoform X2 [Gigantopelta aegis]|uniref:protein maph-9-like isoform X2 n=1 Tax=Gigantopelta aegis TaxID=1735272 RepID=UPI001B888D38|nr:protein maph-9-like isoform X2 [Gigantopelta aegis]